MSQGTVHIDHNPGDRPSQLFRLAAKAVRSGMLVAFPTETVYGLGASAFNDAALLDVFRVKGRPADNPLIVHVADIDQAYSLMQWDAATAPLTFRRLTEHFWPGPLTLIVPRNAAVSDVATAGLATVGLRMPAHDTALALIRTAGVPLAAPSANVSGAPSPTTADEVMHDLEGRIFAVIDSGQCHSGIESTVLDLCSDVPRVLRPGPVTREEIANTLGMDVDFASSTSERPASPGMKYQHYAPDTPLVLLRGLYLTDRKLLNETLREKHAQGMKVGLLAADRFKGSGEMEFYSLHTGSAADVARHLYLGLRTLDRLGLDLIYTFEVESSGLGMAVMNRLYKAAAFILP
jgi:L-threonylcarbamoyladenylate synthase